VSLQVDRRRSAASVKKAKTKVTDETKTGRQARDRRRDKGRDRRETTETLPETFEQGQNDARSAQAVVIVKWVSCFLS